MKPGGRGKDCKDCSNNWRLIWCQVIKTHQGILNWQGIHTCNDTAASRKVVLLKCKSARNNVERYFG